MENKEVEQMLNSIKVEYALLEGKLFYQSKDVKKLLSDNQSLTKQAKELKQQLSEKNKALDKACEELETFDMTLNNKDFDDVKSKEKWKEYVEHE